MQKTQHHHHRIFILPDQTRVPLRPARSGIGQCFRIPLRQIFFLQNIHSLCAVFVLEATRNTTLFFAFRKPHICTGTCIHGHPRHRHPVAAAKRRHPTAPACDSVRTVSFDGTHPNHSMKLRPFLVPVMHSSS